MSKVLKSPDKGGKLGKFDIEKKENKAFPPARTIEARENQLISLAVDEAERQLRAGTASSQVITHYLKLGSTREKLEMERLRRENDLLKAKTDALESAKKMEELVDEALKAMRSYSGVSSEEDYD